MSVFLVVCYWPPVRGVCPNYEVVEFKPRTVTPPKPRLRCLLLRICSLPVPTSPPAVQCYSGVAPTFSPDTPSTDARLVSAQDYPPTRASPVSIPAYRYSCSHPHPLLCIFSFIYICKIFFYAHVDYYLRSCV